MENHRHNPVQAVGSAADVNERRLDKHRPVARALRGGAAAGADEILTLAHAQVALWERGRLRSQDYRCCNHAGSSQLAPNFDDMCG